MWGIRVRLAHRGFRRSSWEMIASPFQRNDSLGVLGDTSVALLVPLGDLAGYHARTRPGNIAARLIPAFRL